MCTCMYGVSAEALANASAPVEQRGSSHAAVDPHLTCPKVLGLRRRGDQREHERNEDEEATHPGFLGLALPVLPGGGCGCVRRAARSRSRRCSAISQQQERKKASTHTRGRRLWSCLLQDDQGLVQDRGLVEAQASKARTRQEEGTINGCALFRACTRKGLQPNQNTHLRRRL